MYPDLLEVILSDMGVAGFILPDGKVKKVPAGEEHADQINQELEGALQFRIVSYDTVSFALDVYERLTQEQILSVTRLMKEHVVDELLIQTYPPVASQGDFKKLTGAELRNWSSLIRKMYN